MSIRFLTLESVVAIHQYQIDQYGGLRGLRDARLLESAIAVPQSAFEGKYLHESLAEMAAAYLFHLVQNHPFADGNKRVGAASAAIFLEMNGSRLAASPDDYFELTRSVASSEIGKSDVAKFFAVHTQAP